MLVVGWRRFCGGGGGGGEKEMLSTGGGVSAGGGGTSRWSAPPPRSECGRLASATAAFSRRSYGVDGPEAIDAREACAWVAFCAAAGSLAARVALAWRRRYEGSQGADLTSWSRNSTASPLCPVFSSREA